MGERALHRGDVAGSSPVFSTICLLSLSIEDRFYFEKVKCHKNIKWELKNMTICYNEIEENMP